MVDHSKSGTISGVTIVRSGDEGFPEAGSLVGESELSRTKLEEVRESRIFCPRAAARVSLVCENQAGLWALKSPKIMESSWGLRRASRSGVKLGGQEEMGGMYMLYMLIGRLLIVAEMARCSVVESLGKRWSVGSGVKEME